MPNNEHGTLSAAGFSRFCMTSRWMLKSDVRSCDLGIVNGLPKLLGGVFYFYAGWRIQF